MIAFDYVYLFKDTNDGLSRVERISCKSGEKEMIKIGLEDMQFAKLASGPLPQILVDLADIALAVYVVDRLTPRGQKSISFHIRLPLRNHEDFLSVKKQIEDILYLYTGDNWEFEFVPRRGTAKLVEISVPFNDIYISQNREVALWSGGIDALAGFHQRWLNKPTKQGFTLFGTGGNRIVHSVQKNLYAASKRAFKTDSTVGLVQVFIEAKLPHRISKNGTPRARGFVFLLLGAVCAKLEGQDCLHIYENGIGAMNLPFRSSELGLDHSRAVHPRLLRKMGEWVSLLFGHSFRFINPFENITKAQMCIELARNSQLEELLSVAISCDRRHHDNPAQCGRCSSCLLRRYSLAWNGVIEPRNRYELTQRVKRQEDIQPMDHLHFDAMSEQVQTMKVALSATIPWIALAQSYSDLPTTAAVVAEHDGRDVTEVQMDLTRLCYDHVQEWTEVAPQISLKSLFEQAA